jgi:cobalamin biosynthesis protein CobD/CbiB
MFTFDYSWFVDSVFIFALAFLIDLVLGEYPDRIHPTVGIGKIIIYLKKKYGGRVSFDKLYSPIGLNLGGSTPGEIALCILAEIQSVSYGRQANHLRLNYDEL